jgi:hypothetical protein
MSKITATQAAQSIARAFGSTMGAHADVKAFIKSKPSVEQRNLFLTTAAFEVAKQASSKFGEKIVAYPGQRGIAFGVIIKDEDGNKSYERTTSCDSTRKWFDYNVAVYFKSGKKAAPESAVWVKIAEELGALKTIARKLDAGQQRAFAKDLAALEAKYAD